MDNLHSPEMRHFTLRYIGASSSYVVDPLTERSQSQILPYSLAKGNIMWQDRPNNIGLERTCSMA